MENKRQKIELADIFASQSETFLSSQKLVNVQKKAFKDILSCRTDKMGGHRRECDNCSHHEQRITLAEIGIVPNVSL